MPAPKQYHKIQFTPDDVVIPRMRVCNQLTEQVVQGRFKTGDIVIGISKDDTEAVKVGGYDEGVTFHVLDMTPKISGEGPTGEFGVWDIDDPAAPAIGGKVKQVSEYTLAVPSYDDGTPVKYTTGGSSAKHLNTALARHQDTGPPWELAFTLTSRDVVSKGKTWQAPSFLLAKPDKKSLAAAEKMSALVTGDPQAQLEAPTEDYV